MTASDVNWVTGLNRGHANANKQSKWIGTNMLGGALQETREALIAGYEAIIGAQGKGGTEGEGRAGAGNIHVLDSDFMEEHKARRESGGCPEGYPVGEIGQLQSRLHEPNGNPFPFQMPSVHQQCRLSKSGHKLCARCAVALPPKEK